MTAMIILPIALLAANCFAVPRQTREPAGKDSRLTVREREAGPLEPGMPAAIAATDLVGNVELSPAGDAPSLPTQAQFWATEIQRSIDQRGSITQSMQALGLTPPLFYKLRGLIGDTAPLPRDGSPVQSAKARMRAALKQHLDAFGEPQKAYDHFNWTPRYAAEAMGQLGHPVQVKLAPRAGRAALASTPTPASPKRRGRPSKWLDHPDRQAEQDERSVAKLQRITGRRKSKAAGERSSDLPTLQEFSERESLEQVVRLYGSDLARLNAKIVDLNVERNTQWKLMTDAEVSVVRADRRSLIERERNFLKRHLDAARGDLSSAARSLGIPGEDGGVAVLQNKLRRLGLLGY